jgi:hypothetical protein
MLNTIKISKNRKFYFMFNLSFINKTYLNLEIGGLNLLSTPLIQHQVLNHSIQVAHKKLDACEFN